jgi:hypothetical protein
MYKFFDFRKKKRAERGGKKEGQKQKKQRER